MGSRLYFFSKGVTCAVLNEVGKIPCEKESRKFAYNGGEDAGKLLQQENRDYISKGEDLFGRELINLMISSTLGGEKNERFD